MSHVGALLQRAHCLPDRPDGDGRSDAQVAPFGDLGHEHDVARTRHGAGEALQRWVRAAGSRETMQNDPAGQAARTTSGPEYRRGQLLVTARIDSLRRDRRVV